MANPVPQAPPALPDSRTRAAGIKAFSGISQQHLNQDVVDLVPAVLRDPSGTGMFTSTGLIVTAVLDDREYPTGIKIPDKVMKALPVTRHDWHGEWNYTLHPADTPEPEAVDSR